MSIQYQDGEVEVSFLRGLHSRTERVRGLEDPDRVTEHVPSSSF